MFTPSQSSYEKYYDAPPPAQAPAPPSFTDETTNGIPMSGTTSQYYYSEDSRSKNKIPWSTGLCDCFSDCRNCCVTFWCPCITFGQIAEIVDKGSSACGVNGALYTLIACVTCCACCYSCFYRSKMRQQYALEKSPCGDCLTHCCCEYCALCQEYRELKSRGYDLALGWHGNAEKKNSSLEMVPPLVEDGMSR